jgi:hypothetical protein
MKICDHRHRRLWTLQGPLHLINKLVHCPDRACPSRPRTFSSWEEVSIAPPFWTIGWDLFAWVGHRRFSRHWSVSQLRAELYDSHGIELSDDSLERYIARYQAVVAARHQDPRQLATAYDGIEDLVLTIDGLQPEKGHETLYVVRELRARRVWFAEALLSNATSEIEPLLLRAQHIAQRLGKPIGAWMSDKQQAFVTGIAKVFPQVPHRFCKNHFLHRIAKPVMQTDRQAKIQIRKKVRGLRQMEREVLDRTVVPTLPTNASTESVQGPSMASNDANTKTLSMPTPTLALPTSTPTASTQSLSSASSAAVPRADPASGEADSVVLDYCATVRGILHEDQGGPLDPSSLRMADALTEVRRSLARCLAAKNGV